MVRLARILTCSLGLAVLAQAGPASAREAFVTEFQQKQVVVFDTQTNQLVGSPIPLGEGTHQIAITPDGHRAYTADLNADKVFAIDTQAKASLGSITVGARPSAVAITPDGRRVYVANSGTGTGANTVSVIDTQTNQTVGPPIPVGTSPNGIAITPDGTRAYVTNSGDNTVAVIDLQTNQVVGSPIPVGMNPLRIAITPNGARLYVTNLDSDNVSVIDTATNQMIGSPIPTADDPEPLAITPDGTRVIVGHYNADAVSIIDTATNQVVGSPIPVGHQPGCDRNQYGWHARVCEQRRRQHRRSCGDRHPNWSSDQRCRRSQQLLDRNRHRSRPAAPGRLHAPRDVSRPAADVQRSGVERSRREHRALRLVIWGRERRAQRRSGPEPCLRARDVSALAHSHRQRGLLDGLRLHRADRLMQRWTGRYRERDPGC
jgi:YVTN family beta-propeller protein